jgi:glycosyltransferase involved in cell wall biosynthesis
MRIIVDSHFFHPSVGGVEMMSEGLARAWESRGHRVTVVTDTPRNGHEEPGDLEVVRGPSIVKKIRLAQWADVYVRSGNSLKSLPWPVLTGTPHVTIHHRPLAESHMKSVRLLMERGATFLCHNVAVSTAVAETLPGRTTTIPNTFRTTFDQSDADKNKREGLLFVGRLVSRKGIDVAVEALRDLRDRGERETLTICGDGPERETLEAKVRQLKLEDAVHFEGWSSPEELAEKYRNAAATLVPSRKEPFGIVALESIASRCPVVASNVGGLPEAVGDCGILVEPESPEALADGIEKALHPDVRETLRDPMAEHVNRHRIDRIAEEYLEVLESVVNDVVNDTEG